MLSRSVTSRPVDAQVQTHPARGPVAQSAGPTATRAAFLRSALGFLAGERPPIAAGTQHEDGKTAGALTRRNAIVVALGAGAGLALSACGLKTPEIKVPGDVPASRAEIAKARDDMYDAAFAEAKRIVDGPDRPVAMGAAGRTQSSVDLQPVSFEIAQAGGRGGSGSSGGTPPVTRSTSAGSASSGRSTPPVDSIPSRAAGSGSSGGTGSQATARAGTPTARSSSPTSTATTRTPTPTPTTRTPTSTPTSTPQGLTGAAAYAYREVEDRMYGDGDDLIDALNTYWSDAFGKSSNAYDARFDRAEKEVDYYKLRPQGETDDQRSKRRAKLVDAVGRYNDWR